MFAWVTATLAVTGQSRVRARKVALVAGRLALGLLSSASSPRSGCPNPDATSFPSKRPDERRCREYVSS